MLKRFPIPKTTSTTAPDLDQTSDGSFQTQGDEAFRNGQYADAIFLYETAIAILTRSDDDDDDDTTPPTAVKQRLSKLWCSISACHLRLHHWRAAKHAATTAIELDSSNDEAYRHRSEATSELCMELTEDGTAAEGSTVAKTKKKQRNAGILAKLLLFRDKKQREGAMDKDWYGNVIDGYGFGVEEECADRIGMGGGYDDTKETLPQSLLSNQNSKYDIENPPTPTWHDTSNKRLTSSSSSSSQQPPQSQPQDNSSEEWFVYDTTIPTNTTERSSHRDRPIAKLHLKITSNTLLDGLASTFSGLKYLLLDDDSQTSNNSNNRRRFLECHCGISYNLTELRKFRPTLRHLELNLSEFWTCRRQTNNINDDDVLEPIGYLINLKTLTIRHLRDGTASMLRHFETLRKLQYLYYQGTNHLVDDEMTTTTTTTHHNNNNDDDDDDEEQDFKDTARVLFSKHTLDLSDSKQLQSVTFVGCSFCAPFEQQQRSCGKQQPIILPRQIKRISCIRMYGSDCTDILRRELETDGVVLLEDEALLAMTAKESEGNARPFLERVEERSSGGGGGDDDGGIWVSRRGDTIGD